VTTTQAYYQLLADGVVLAHVAFVIFALFGGFLVLKWRRLIWVHSTAVIWAALVEFFGWICPLTPVENWLREKAGQAVYRSDFIAHYILPLLYPEGLTRTAQIILGLFVLVVNLGIYARLFRASKG
jgi:uncharacterized protein DUF2784